MKRVDDDNEELLSAIALAKLTRVFGVNKGTALYRSALKETALEDIRTADELLVFATHLTGAGGMVAAVGGLLSVAAVLRGARASTNGQ